MHLPAAAGHECTDILPPGDQMLLTGKQWSAYDLDKHFWGRGKGKKCLTIIN